MKARFLLAAFLIVAGCKTTPGPERSGDKTTGEAGEAGHGTPVGVALLTVGDVDVTLDATAHTEALAKVRVIAPFAGTLVSLRVAEGDRVRAGQTLGTMLARESEAALRGAESMVHDAKSPSEIEDARRAVELAKASGISATITSPTDGVVLVRDATAGDRVTDGEELLTVAAAGSIVLLAEVPQTALARVHAEQKATVILAAGPTIDAVVHGVLPAADSAGSTARVRLDASRPMPLGVGLFGIARIVVETRKHVLIAPAQAVLRDDISGVNRIAVIGSEGTAHWVDVHSSPSADGRAEVEGAGLVAGTRVIVSGQVGLPEGALVVAAP